MVLQGFWASRLVSAANDILLVNVNVIDVGLSPCRSRIHEI